MLRHLTVRDFAQVKSLEIELDSGLTVITGESGAGKSILFGALALVLGERADSGAIRPGAQRIDVAAEFDLAGNETATAYLAEHELTDPDEPNRCLLRRTVTKAGRSRSYLNGTPVNLKDLARIADGLIDVHGQNENQSLLSRRVQLSLLDDFAEAGPLAHEVSQTFRRWRESLADLALREQTLRESSNHRELLVYQIGELDELGLGLEEWDEIDVRHRRLAQVEALQQRVATALEALTDDEAGARNRAGFVVGQLADIDDAHPALDAARDLLRAALEQLDDAGTELRHYFETLQADPEELATLDKRLESVSELARKHRVAANELAMHHATLIQELAALSSDAGTIDELRATVATLESDYQRRAAELSEIRRGAAPAFEAEISAHMHRLGIPAGALSLVFAPAATEAGLESVDYHVTTNPKLPASPLVKTASGGERSRISLAIQIVAARRSRIPALVLDEADVGIGGTTADAVGRLLRALADHTQVLCVTHAPQVAALGQHHLNVARTSDHDTRIVELDREHRVAELARMLGGQEVTAKTREYAEELMNDA